MGLFDAVAQRVAIDVGELLVEPLQLFHPCLLYTSDAADERSSVDLGGRRIIKKKNNEYTQGSAIVTTK